MTGGYDDGYRSCPCFWGSEPGSLLVRLESFAEMRGRRVLDAGCGEGKNAAYAVSKGATVDAVDISAHALRNGRRKWGGLSGIQWHECDIQAWGALPKQYDVVIAYGLLHCLDSSAAIAHAVSSLKGFTTHGGYHLICALNSRRQELAEAHPALNPTLLSHAEYVALYSRDEIVLESDADLTEVHPDKGIQHTHSLTRMIVRISHDA